MEIADVDPQLGGVFYTLEQQPGGHPRFERQTQTCLQCHDSSSITGGVPGFILRSVFPDRYGYVITSIGDGPTTDRTPIDDRWGGWYVTGTLGGQRHMGNLFAPQLVHEVDNARRALATSRDASTGDVTDLKGRVSTRPYLSASSDAVALMVLAHQTHVHNLITIAGYEQRQAAYDRQLMRESSGDSPAAADQLDLRVQTASERLVHGLLFATAGEAGRANRGHDELRRRLPGARPARSPRAIAARLRPEDAAVPLSAQLSDLLGELQRAARAGEELRLPPAARGAHRG